MAGKRVAVISPDGQFGTVDEADAEAVTQAGGRVLSQKQVAEREAQVRQDERAEKAGLGGKLQTVVGAVGGALNPLMFTGGPGSTGEAYNKGVTSGLTSGLSDVGVRKAIDATAGVSAGAKYAQQVDDIKATSPAAHTAGEVMGFAAGATAMPASPAGLIGKAGSLAERGAGLVLKGGGSALRQAAVSGGKMAFRGGVEGAIVGASQSAADDLLHDDPINGQKLYAAVGNSALAGAVLGGGLGTGGSLLSSGVKAARGGAARALSRGAAEVRSPREVPFIDADAGLRDLAPTAEGPIRFDAAKQPIGIRPQGGNARAPSFEEPISMSRSLRIDPDAGLHAPTPSADATPIFSEFSQGSNKATRRAAVESGLFEGAEKAHETRLAGDVFRASKIKAGPRPVESIWDIGVDPDAGIAARNPRGKFQPKAPAAEDALQFRKAPPSRAALGEGLSDLSPIESRPAIRMPESPPPTPAGAQKWAADQAWKAVGGGFGLQTTRFAKQAQKYFGDTSALGEVVLRRRLIDIPENATPLQAAWHAGATGTPDAIALRAATDLNDVGAKIADITEQSGARIPLRDVHSAIDGVRSQYARIAGYEHVVAALDTYEANLAQKLAASPDGTTSIQRALEQRKGLDRLVYEEAKTMDPKGRVAALREVRSKLEGVIADALDGASGKVPGELRSEYATLKKDYHALSIIREAAEDSAARAAKGATFGMFEKAGAAMSLAHGNVTAAPVLALGGKVLRERGNAAAAAFLTKMSEQKAVLKLLKQSEDAVTRSSAGALREAEPAPAKTPKAKAAAQVTAEQGRAEQRSVVEHANAIVKWTSDVKASPQRVLNALQEAGAVIGRAAGTQTSSAYTEATMRAMQFIMRYVPTKERRDPLDPRSVPPLTFEEAARLVRATTYATKPMTVWKDFERGIVTPEGLAAATEFMPDQFTDFRAQLLDHVTNHLARGERLSAAQRLRVDKLLGIPGGADLRGPALVQLQANLAPEGPDNSAGPTPAKNGGGNGPVNMQVQQSGFDAVEARKSG